MSAHDLLGITTNQWMNDAACAGYETDLWFPDSYKSQRTRVKEALKICHTCPVRSQCLEFALDNEEEFGIWGGLTEGQRYELLRRSKAAKPCVVDGCVRPRGRRADDRGWRSMCEAHVERRGDEVAS